MGKSKVRTVEIDEHFFVPPGVIDVRQENKENSEFVYDPEDQAQDAPVLESPEAIVPMFIDGVIIVEQRVRLASDGRSVVDVTLEFPDAVGVIDIEVRTSKI